MIAKRLPEAQAVDRLLPGLVAELEVRVAGLRNWLAEVRVTAESRGWVGIEGGGVLGLKASPVRIKGSGA